MLMLRMQAKLVALVLAAVVLLVAECPLIIAQGFTVEHQSQQQQVSVAGDETPSALNQIQPAADDKRELPKILDFANFKLIFKKHYSGWCEELVRCKLFLSRAMRAVLSAIRYQAGYDSHYLAVNEMSDATLDERERMKNKQLEEFVKRQGGGFWSNRANSSSIHLAEFYLNDTRPEAIMAELARHSGDRATEELRHLGEQVALERKKREVATGGGQRHKHRRRRTLTMDQLIRGPVSEQLPPLVKKKMRARVPSNNPDYAGQIEPATMGLADQQEQVNYININPAPTATLDTFLAQVSEEMTAAEPMDIDSGNSMPDEVELPDAIFTDLRHTNCFLTPRNQGTCGCCYAFSMIAIAEFLHCIKTGQLVAFSEQYMIDCGRGYIPNLNGCSGAGPVEAGQFLHNFGMELRVQYPYLTREGQCPYAPDVDLKTTGYIRTEIGNAVAIDEQLWPEYLRHGPMWVGIVTSPDFNEYAGGVHQSTDCAPEHGLHAMVLIGHGREDGTEFWLFRNSYGPGWGESGHYKLARSAPCIVTPGFMYGTVDGREYTMNLERNTANDGQIVSLNYARNQAANGGQQAFGG